MKTLLIFGLVMELIWGAVKTSGSNEVRSVHLSKQEPDTRFEFLHPKTNISSIKFIGRIKVLGKNEDSSVPKLYFKLRDKAYELGGNCFKVHSYVKKEHGRETLLTLDVYRAHDSIFSINSANFEKNKIFVFLDDSDSDETYSFKINSIDRKIKSSTYYKYDIKVGVDVEIDAGGFFGATINYKWKEYRNPVFLSLTGFALNVDHAEPDYMARYLNTKRLTPIDKNLGQLLVILFKQVNQ